jgi:uncharacterized protein
MSHEKRPYIDITILLDMIALGQVETVEEVLNASPGYDVNQKNKLGTFPAILAASKNNFRLLKLLVNHGAVLDQKDGLGRTVMGFAQKYNNQEMIEFIETSLASASESSARKKAKLTENTPTQKPAFTSQGVAKSIVKGH